MLEDLFSEMDLCILNDGSLTYIHPATGSTSALDLSVCGPSLVLDYETMSGIYMRICAEVTTFL